MAKEKDYQAIFFTGITFIALGVVFMNSVNSELGTIFLGVGGLFMIIGGANKDKWKETKKKKPKKK
jgi:hypothetical protein